MIVKLRSSLKNQQGQGFAAYVLIITLVALVAIAAFVYFKAAIKSKIDKADLEAAQKVIQAAAEKEIKTEVPSCRDGMFLAVFEECYQQGVEVTILAKVESHVSCPFPKILVDLNGCMVFRVLPETIKRLDQAIVEVQMVPTRHIPIEFLPEPGERTLFALANYRPVPNAKEILFKK